MNIVGEGFNTKITEQIKQRQKIYGSINRNNDELNYLNSKTGWCRLVSSVDVNVDGTTIRNLGLSGTSLAKQYVLFSGTQAGERIREGVAVRNNLHSPYAYGLGGTEFGLKPMPGIKSAKITTETRGSIKKATLQIQANNRFQFDIIDILYMRLGYSVLLEWGNSSYYNNNGTYIKDNTHSLENAFLTKKHKGENVTYETILSLIEKERYASCGNYDALFAKVVNFSWTYTKEGTYNITINLISLGDVIESLKANNLLNGLQTTPTQEQRKSTEEENAGKTIQNIETTSTNPFTDVNIINKGIDVINSVVDWFEETSQNENLY